MSLTRYKAFIIVLLLLGISAGLLAIHYWASIQSMLGLLFTRHNIKGGVALLTPVVIGGATVYIAWQQYLLGRTQEKISEDQRDIAHYNQRIDLFDKLYGIYKVVEDAHREIKDLEYRMPNNVTPVEPVSTGIISPKWGPVFDQIGSSNWCNAYMEKKQKASILLDECEIVESKARFVFDDGIVKIIKMFIVDADALFRMKVKCIELEVKYGRSDASVRDEREGVVKRQRRVDIELSLLINSLSSYLNITDITERRAL